MNSLHLVNVKHKPNDPPYTRDSIARAKAFQQSVRLQTALELGIPRDLVALYDVFGYERVAEWTRVLLMLREP